MFQRGVEVSHETIRSWSLDFAPDSAGHIKRRRLVQGRTLHLDEIDFARNATKPPKTLCLYIGKS